MGFTMNCPLCGSRSYHEFWFGGELRPWKPDPTVTEEYETTWLRDNDAGPQLERWFHFAGCRRWLTVKRDTRSNEVMVITEGGRPARSQSDTQSRSTNP